MDINLDENAVVTETQVQETEKDNAVNIDSVDIVDAMNDGQQDEAVDIPNFVSANEECSIPDLVSRTDIKWNIDKSLSTLLGIANSDITVNEKYIRLINVCSTCDKYLDLANTHCTNYTTVAKMIGREEEVYIISLITSLFHSFNAFNNSDAEKFVNPVTILTGLCSIISLIGETYYIVGSIDTSFAISEVSDAAKHIRDISNSIIQFYNDIGFTSQDNVAFAMDICHNITWNKKLAAWIEADL